MKRKQSAARSAIPAFRTIAETADFRTIEGLGIPFGGPFPGNSDDWATRATPKTNFAWDLFPDRTPTDPAAIPARFTRPVTYHHATDQLMRSTRLGGWSPVRMDKWGVWVQAQISKREAWSEAIMELLDHDALSFSSQALAASARFSNKGDWVDWAVAEMALTPTPSNAWAGLTARTSQLAQLFSITTDDATVFAQRQSATAQRCAACDVSLATNIQGELAQLMGTEQGEADQVALLKTAFDAVGQFIAAEAEEIGSDEGDESVQAWASAHLAHRVGKRNNGNDQKGIDAMHDLTVQLGASAHAGDNPPNDETHQEPEPEARAAHPPDDRSTTSRLQTAAQPERIRIVGLPG